MIPLSLGCFVVPGLVMSLLFGLLRAWSREISFLGQPQIHRSAFRHACEAHNLGKITYQFGQNYIPFATIVFANKNLGELISDC